MICPKLPPVPDTTTQRPVAEYLVRLHGVAVACEQALAEMREWAASN